MSVEVRVKLECSRTQNMDYGVLRVVTQGVDSVYQSQDSNISNTYMIVSLIYRVRDIALGRDNGSVRENTAR